MGHAARAVVSPHTVSEKSRSFLALTLVIGALTGLAVVAFIVVTERLGMHLYPMGSAPWRRFFIPVLGSLAMGYLLYRYFPHARSSGVMLSVTSPAQGW
jgi:CIC family chloride channel protein